MLFRLFVEASVDYYIREKRITVVRGESGRQPELGKRVELALAHLRAGNSEARQALKSVQTAFSEKHGLFALATLHEYVHNPSWQPVPDNLRIHFDNYAEFLRLLWE